MLKKQAGTVNYIAIDTSIMPLETSKELLSSLVYTLSVVESEDGIPIGSILLGDFYAVTKRGHEILDQKKDEVYEEWKNLCEHAPKIENKYYSSTIEDIETFFDEYDVKYAAHQIPCRIDYPLLAPVSSESRGVSFIEEYIRRIQIESRLLKGFERDEILKILKCVTTDYKKDFFNLCEPVLICAIARVILGYSIESLSISKEDVEKLYDFFKEKTRGEALTAISNSIDKLQEEEVLGENQSWYFTEEIKSLVARIAATENVEGLAKIFIPH